jgi:hypothetical protein
MLKKNLMSTLRELLWVGTMLLIFERHPDHEIAVLFEDKDAEQRVVIEDYGSKVFPEQYVVTEAQWGGKVMVPRRVS